MPYAANAELPPAVRSRYSERCQSVFRKTFNAATGDESAKFRIAHSAARNCMESTTKAELSAASRNRLPDSAFACPEKRLYPIHDAAHVRNALARVADPSNDQCGKSKILAAARKFGIKVSGKALLPLKAQALDPEEHEAWFAGQIPRRLLAIPFGGPIMHPLAPRGVDLDGEWFSERTDLFGSYKALRDSLERRLDFQHGRDQLMRRVAIGKSILNPDPDEDGWWVDAWLAAGSKHLAMVKRLVERGAQLFGSSEAASKTVDPDSGEITEWPMILETLTPTPINTLSVMRPVKAADPNDSVGLPDSIAALIADLDALTSDLTPTSSGEESAKAARVVSNFVAAVQRVDEAHQ
jgi:cation transport regulator ChaB